MKRYNLEFILHAKESSAKSIESSLSEFGEILEITVPTENTHDFKVNLNTEEPTIIFDICSQMGRIRTVKVNEVK